MNVDQPPLLPVRMITEFVYCPRLAYLEWVQREWQDSVDVVEGRRVHQRVDREQGTLPDAGAEIPGTLHVRSLTVSSEALGVIGRLDLVEAHDGALVPVEYKRGARPHVEKSAYLPDRVQLCVQGLLLRDLGHRCDEGIIYYAESRERVPVVFDAVLRAEALAAVEGLRMLARDKQIPPPLEDSPKCPRCSLVGICLPDEVNHLRGASVNLRPLAVSHTDALPLYVQAHKASVRKKGETL